MCTYGVDHLEVESVVDEDFTGVIGSGVHHETVSGGRGEGTDTWNMRRELNMIQTHGNNKGVDTHVEMCMHDVL